MAGRVGAVIGIVHADRDGLGGNVKPLIRDSDPGGLLRREGKVGTGRAGGRQHLVALQHHVQQRLEMHELVLEADPYSAGNGSGHLACSGAVVAVEAAQAGPQAGLVVGDDLDGGPLVGHGRVGVAVLRVVDVRVNAALEDDAEHARLRGRLARRLAQLDVEKGRDVAQVEDEGVAELDGLLVEHLRRDHVPRHRVPCLPHALPVLEGGQRSGGVERRVPAIGEGGALKHVEAFCEHQTPPSAKKGSPTASAYRTRRPGASTPARSGRPASTACRSLAWST